VAKNVLSVGASLSSDASFEYELHDYRTDINASALNGDDDDFDYYFDDNNNNTFSTNTNSSAWSPPPYYPLTCANFSESAPCESGMAFFSSNGPTYDTRIGVDVVAPGLFVMAAASNTECSTTPMAGTSMAAAVVAGA
jgi:hypothetical protein